MNETMKSIFARRSCKAYKDEKLPIDVVKQILVAGTKAPSALNKQSASIICIDNDSILELLRNNLIDFVGKDPFYGARTIAIVVADNTTKHAIKDGSCVLENMFIAATSLGVGSCWINCLHDYFATEEGHNFKVNVLKLKDHEITVGTCALGYPVEDIIPEKPKKDNYIRII